MCLDLFDLECPKKFEEFAERINKYFCLFQIHAIYRSSGASLAKAQQEFTTEFLRNQHVQNVASNAASAAVQSQFNSNRY